MCAGTVRDASPRWFSVRHGVPRVQRVLGHASAAMTLDIDADLFDDDLEAVAVALDQARSRESVGKMWARDGQNGGLAP